MSRDSSTSPQLSLWGATGVGVAAIVGGGILALAGVAFSSTGPSAILAFGINGVIALFTAASFAEVATRFPQSGGTYIYAKKVLSLEVSFIVGWVVWFASIAASVLYGIGFGAFASLTLVAAFGDSYPGAVTFLSSRFAIAGLAVGATIFYTAMISRNSGGTGKWSNIAKLFVFVVLIVAGAFVAAGRPFHTVVASFQPFLTHGSFGLIQAMGFTFIALQGFDLIAAVAGNIRNPQTAIPRAMFLSLGIALAIYLPLLAVVATVGIPPGESLETVSAESQEALVAVAAGNYLGAYGYWFVLAAGVFSMLSALQANLLAASHIASAMARDRLLPHMLHRANAQGGTPKRAVFLTAAIVLCLTVLVPNLEAAGAAASLIFLISFALVHGMCILLRLRTGTPEFSFRTPLFPSIPLLGGVACFALAIFQAITVQSAGIITAVCMGVGAILFIVLFARRARVVDAGAMAIDPDAIRLRGRSPLVLVPIANPESAAGMVAVAHALTPPRAGRALLLAVVRPPEAGETESDPFRSVQSVLREALTAAARSHYTPETLVTVAPDPWKEIARVARAHQCECLLLGLSSIDGVTPEAPVNVFLSKIHSDVVILRAGRAWHPDEVSRILVPVGGGGVNERLLARLIGSLLRGRGREITFLRVVAESTSQKQLDADTRKLRRAARDISPVEPNVRIVKGNALETIVEAAGEHDLLILGAQRVGGSRTLIGGFAVEIARRTSQPLLIINERF